MKRLWREIKLAINQEICYRMMNWIVRHFPDEYGRLMWAQATETILNNLGHNDYSLASIGPTELLVKLDSEGQTKIAHTRARFAQAYCDARSWNMNTLTERQLAEIQMQQGWTHPSPTVLQKEAHHGS